MESQCKIVQLLQTTEGLIEEPLRRTAADGCNSSNPKLPCSKFQIIVAYP
ncbi:unnamed protein product [Linum tenue]|uniref:Uncharacterized protein n=1 Tax=Linum tenue TaxID=586396 RepID=A0AAV0JEV1_9ROSI|nr:unnamed protein product [Linum tenue]